MQVVSQLLGGIVLLFVHNFDHVSTTALPTSPLFQRQSQLSK